MQPNVLTFAVDEENDGIDLADHVFTRFEEFQNRAMYISADHTLVAKDTFGMYRTLPKSNGNFKGVAKTSIKFSKDIQVDGLDGVSKITAPIIMEVSVSLPVGTTPETAMIMRQRVISALDRDDVMVPLMEQLMV